MVVSPPETEGFFVGEIVIVKEKDFRAYSDF